jgi:hypothetical protein
MEQTGKTTAPAQETIRDEDEGATVQSAPDREMPCPVCGHSMPDLKGGKDSICPVCGFKDSCCY